MRPSPRWSLDLPFKNPTCFLNNVAYMLGVVVVVVIVIVVVVNPHLHACLEVSFHTLK